MTSKFYPHIFCEMKNDVQVVSQLLRLGQMAGTGTCTANNENPWPKKVVISSSYNATDTYKLRVLYNSCIPEMKA